VVCSTISEMNVPVSILLMAPPRNAISTLSLHDALPIFQSPHRAVTDLLLGDRGIEGRSPDRGQIPDVVAAGRARTMDMEARALRSEEHTSELQSPYDLVCRLLLEKKKTMSSAQSKRPLI